jgi:hypothetical protein
MTLNRFIRVNTGKTLKLQYHLIFSLYATFNMIFVSIISTLHVSARIGHLQVLTELYLFMLTY